MLEIDLHNYSSIPTRPSLQRPAQLLKMLADALPLSEVAYLDGKTEMRTALMERTGCSAAEAEQAIDRLERTGAIRYEGDPAGGPGHWLQGT